MLSDLRERGGTVSEEQRARLFAPAGLDLGAESAHEIALAIVAEIQAVLADHPVKSGDVP
jgi:xanthine/CO dehydrogenase XdhC/CoxF family maturation factor